MLNQKTTTATTGQQGGTDGIQVERNWSEIPDDILHLFSKKLPDISDFIRFRVVCKSWKLSAPVNDPPPQLPWLLESRDEEDCKNGIIRFYCLSSGIVHTISCPASCRAWLKGPACRYLFAFHMRNSDRYLINPLTCDQIHVPDVSKVCRFPIDYFGPDPIKGGDIHVISGCTKSNRIAFWRPEADDWVYMEGVSRYNFVNAYYMGQYFSNDVHTGITDVFDIATKKLAYQVAPPVGTKGCTLMVVSAGKLLRLLRRYDYNTGQYKFDIYCLYFGDCEGKPCWLKISDIGDQMLFLSFNHGLSICASNVARLKGNCIYYLKKGPYICRYDIRDGTTELLPCPFDFMETWFVPSLV